MKDSGKKESLENNKTLYIGIGVLLVAIAILVSLIMYYKQVNDSADSERLASIVANNVETNNQTESASSSIGKSIEEEEKENTSKTNTTNNTTNSSISNTSNTQKNATNTTKSNKKTNTVANTTKANTTSQNSVSTSSNVTDTNSNTNSNSNSISANSTTTQDNKNETKKELTFVKPVDGNIIKEFAKDSLTYSETLKEWVTHTAIDIRANETTVVKASEAGTVKSIKNDPRYGLTVVIEHDDGYQTVYSNLLTSEFVVEGEKVTQGQTIGTVGNTSAFEIADEAHLHFSMIKDSEYVDPTIYLK